MERLHRYTRDGRRYVIDTETCFCFECDDISWDVLERYPEEPVNRIRQALADRHDPKELAEVVGELEWLRATKAILPAPKAEEDLKRFDLKRGLHTLTVRLRGGVKSAGWLRRGGADDDGVALLSRAGNLLLARAGERARLRLEALAADADALPDAAALGPVFQLAGLAGKELTVALGLAGAPGAFHGHTLTALAEASSAEDLDAARDRLRKAGHENPARTGKHLGAGRVRLSPGVGGLRAAVEALAQAGVRHIELDLDAAFSGTHPPALEDFFTDLDDTARYYAAQLEQGRYFRLEPFAGLFKRIYEGTPIRRHDPAGVHALAVDADGGLYPAAALLGRAELRLGSVIGGDLDAERIRAFDDLGVETTAPCLRCWARRLCGGGAAATHLALGGAVNRPAPAWCDGQRAWLEGCVAAFNVLSTAGVNFTRVHESLAPSGRPSLFTVLKAVKAAAGMQLTLRPIEESDAELLTRWENWNESAYFLTHESSMFMATRYDREMDALHPRTFEQESLLTRRDGTPVGLLRLRPAQLPGTAHLWLYLRDPALYADARVRRSFRLLLDQAAGAQALKRLLAPVGPGEDALATFLEAANFNHAGTQAQALYLHGAWHDLRVYEFRG